MISVVDERTIGPVTRSRLTLEITRERGAPVEVTTRVAFPTPAARGRVKVGGTDPVRYDRDDPTPPRRRPAPRLMPAPEEPICPARSLTPSPISAAGLAAAAAPRRRRAIPSHGLPTARPGGVALQPHRLARSGGAARLMPAQPDRARRARLAIHPIVADLGWAAPRARGRGNPRNRRDGRWSGERCAPGRAGRPVRPLSTGSAAGRTGRHRRPDPTRWPRSTGR